MKKKLLGIALTLCMVLTQLPMVALAAESTLTAAEYAAASPAAAPETDYVLDTTNKILTIKTAKGAAFWSASGTAYLSYTVKLANSIDVSAFLWTPVGGLNDFTGTFDGQGHVLKGMTVVMDGIIRASAGLFGSVSGATIKNVGLINSSVTINNTKGFYYNDAGGIVGAARFSTITNCYNAGSVAYGGSYSYARAGGIVSYAWGGAITNCYSTCSVAANSSNLDYSGGVIGFANASPPPSVTNCYYLASAADKGIGGGTSTATSCGTFTDNSSNLTAGTETSFGSAQTLTYTGTLLNALSGWVNTTASTNYYTWKADSGSTNGGCPVFDAAFVPPTYTITASTATNGSYTVKVGDSEVSSAKLGDTVTITPAANNGYEVDTVTVCKTGDMSATVAVSNNTFTMPAYAVTISVTFTLNTYSLTYTAGENGTLTGSATQTVNHGGSGTAVMAVPNTGYHFVKWSDDVTTATRTDANVMANVSVTATFALNTYAIKKTDTTNGSFTVAESARSGDTVTITPTASSGYEVDKVSVFKTSDTNTVVTVSGITFTMPDYAITVSVTFKAKPSTPTGGGDGGGGSSTSTTSTTPVIVSSIPTTPAAPVIVGGKTENIGKVETTTNGTKVTVDSDKLSNKINASEKGGSVEVPVPGSKAAATAEIVVKNVQDMAKKDMTLEVESGDVSYQLPAMAMDTPAVMEALGASDAGKVPLNVTITKLDKSAVTVVNGELVVPPVEFTVTATYGGKTVEISGFNKYVQRSIEISKEQAAQITTAVVKNEDGTLRHVPTFVYQLNGKWYARINSRTNSTYALIRNKTAFADAKGKWYENSVSEMASRKIVNGKTATAFDGDAGITRAEFAAIVTRALGLPADGKCSFTDVKSSDWYYGAVGTAVKYGLVNGCKDGSFAPNADITRQEAMAIVQRAAKIAEFTGTTGSLASFTDNAKVSAWAKSAAEFNIGSGLIVGSKGELRPGDGISRAETATVILRLLQKAGLVDVRSKT